MSYTYRIFNIPYPEFAYNNKINDDGVLRLLHGVINSPTWRNIVQIDFSNNYIGDQGAFYLADTLTGGFLPNTRYLDISGNQITINGAVFCLLKL